jgi:hypothetical protein
MCVSSARTRNFRKHVQTSLIFENFRKFAIKIIKYKIWVVGKPKRPPGLEGR